jgi:hypothetical protein
MPFPDRDTGHKLGRRIAERAADDARAAPDQGGYIHATAFRHFMAGR